MSSEAVVVLVGGLGIMMIPIILAVARRGSARGDGRGGSDATPVIIAGSDDSDGGDGGSDGGGDGGGGGD